MSPESKGDARFEVMAQVLAAFPEVRLALLFGSEARGTAGRDSDVDVAVDAPATSLGQVAAALSSRLGAEVDVVRLDTASIPLLEALIADAVVLHESKPGAGALWRSRVLAQLETDRDLLAAKLAELHDRMQRVKATFQRAPRPSALTETRSTWSRST